MDSLASIIRSMFASGDARNVPFQQFVKNVKIIITEIIIIVSHAQLDAINVHRPPSAKNARINMWEFQESAIDARYLNARNVGTT